MHDDDDDDDEPEPRMRTDDYVPLDPLAPLFSFHEIAKVLEVTPDGARKIHDRAIAKLRRGLAREASGLPVEAWAFDEL